MEPEFPLEVVLIAIKNILDYWCISIRRKINFGDSRVCFFWIRFLFLRMKKPNTPKNQMCKLSKVRQTVIGL